MVQRLRQQPAARGLLHGQGGYVTMKHHGLLVASRPAERRSAPEYGVQADAEARRDTSLCETLRRPGPA